MSIVIRGMEMPQNCLSCPFQQWDGEDTICYFSGVSALNIARQGTCPINEGFDVGYWAGRRDYEPKWIPVTERLPNGNGEYLVSGKDKVWVCEFMILNGDVGGWCNSARNPCVKYWMPLPEPPEKESE